MNEEILKEIKDRKITRLCHITPFHKAIHILEEGILSPSLIKEDVREINDHVRAFRFSDYVSMSLEYPDFWYYRWRREEKDISDFFVIFLCDPEIMAEETTLFSAINASRNNSNPAPGIKGFNSLFKDPLEADNKIYRRNKLPDNVPTSDLAEVLIYQSVERSHINATVVKTEDNARQLKVSAQLLGLECPAIYITTDFFNEMFSYNLREGILPTMNEYTER